MRFRRSKYGAKKVKADGITFDSKAEYARYLQLKLLEKAGKIYGLQSHVIYPLVVNGRIVGTYEADFVYHVVGGLRVIEDVKGVRTAVYRLKKKIMSANELPITEIDAKDLKIRRR